MIGTRKPSVLGPGALGELTTVTERSPNAARHCSATRPDSPDKSIGRALLRIARVAIHARPESAARHIKKSPYAAVRARDSHRGKWRSDASLGTSPAVTVDAGMDTIAVDGRVVVEPEL
jgi:hypothetical protein